MRVRKRLIFALLCCACALLSACSALPLAGEATPAGPNLSLLAMPAYDDQELTGGESRQDGSLLVDLWLEASQVMGGINPSEESLYPHFSRKYREGGFHYRFEGTVGWYENVLRNILSAAEGSRVRVLRYGNEHLPDAFLQRQGLAEEGAAADKLRSLRRDLLTWAVEPMPSVFSELSAEDMADGFYALGTPQLNRMSLFGDGVALENPGMTEQMSVALDAQIAAIGSGEAGALAAPRDDTDYPLLYALENVDLSRLSVLTCDPASLRRLSGFLPDGSAQSYVDALLRERGVFDRGLCVGVYAFTLDYLGQLSAFGPADLSEPLIWGRLQYNSKTHLSEGALPMPRTLLALVIGQKEQVSRFTASFNEKLDADAALRGLRGPEEGELSYTENGQTVTQQPFSFSWQYAEVQRPGMGYYTQHTPGAALAVSSGEGAVLGDGALRTAVLSPGENGRQESRTLTLSFPAVPPEGGVNVDVSRLQNVRADVVSALLLSETLPNAPDADAATSADRQMVAYRDTLYAFDFVNAPFESDPALNPFAVTGITLRGDTLQCEISVRGGGLRPGYYRLRVCADLAGEQIEWPAVSWADSLNASFTNEQIETWETFSALLTKYDRDAKTIPKQFQHAWGPAATKKYHDMIIPDCPPVSRAYGLSELFTQLRSAANVELSPCIRCVFDVFVTGATQKE